MQQFLHDLMIFAWGFCYDHENWRDTRLYWRGVLSATLHPHTRQVHYRFQWPKMWIVNDIEMEAEFAMLWRGSGR